MQDDFKTWIGGDNARFALGSAHLSTVSKDLFVFSMICQHGFGRTDPPGIRYHALKKCLNELAMVANEKHASVHLPEIGCGEAGGKWPVVEELIQETLGKYGISVTVYRLPNQKISKAVPGWDFTQLLHDLNMRVFFWPGTLAGPIDYGVRHFERYSSERPVFVRIKSAELIRVQGNSLPKFCRYNSGSPRCTQGKGSPRGRTTFIDAADSVYSPSEVVEVTYWGSARMPSTIDIGNSVNGPWKSNVVRST